jgi:hypothetical protein
MAKRYFPPISALCAAMGTTPDALNKPGQISVPSALLRHLIVCAIGDFEIDGELYKEQNQDIAKAFAIRPLSDAESHYKTVGYFEPRPLPIKFDGDYYARRNPDVAKAVRERKLASPWQHFSATGVYELRSPRADLETATAEWRHIIATAKKSPL